MEHGEHSEAHKVITSRKKCYEDNVGSDEESDGAEGYWNFLGGGGIVCGIFISFMFKRLIWRLISVFWF